MSLPTASMCVYQVTCLVTGKHYVGQTRRGLKERWAGHLTDAKYHRGCKVFSNALKKYGQDAFVVRVLEVCNTREALNLREQYWIETVGCLFPNGYNLKTGGDVPVATEYLKAAISAARQRPETKAKASASGKAMWQDPAYIARQKKALAIAMARPEYFEKMSHASAASWSNEEKRKKQSMKHKELWQDPVFKAKRMQDMAPTGEARLKQRQAMQTMWADPVFREQKQKALAAAASTPEAKAKRKATWAKKKEQNEIGT
jgi:group I intron endonuclease